MKIRHGLSSARSVVRQVPRGSWTGFGLRTAEALCLLLSLSLCSATGSCETYYGDHRWWCKSTTLSMLRVVPGAEAWLRAGPPSPLILVSWSAFGAGIGCNAWPVHAFEPLFPIRLDRQFRYAFYYPRTAA